MSSVAEDRRFGVNAGMAVKVPCRAASTIALTLTGEQTVDGVALVSGDRCLVKNQASSINNGIYEVDTGDWVRTPDFDGIYDLTEGTIVKVNGGATMQGFWYVSSSGYPVPGTDAIAFGMASSVLAVISAYGQTLIAAATAAAARVILDVPSNAEAILKSTGTTKGDIVSFTASATSTRKGVGTDGYRLSANSGDTDGLRYLPPPLGFSLINGYLDWTVAGNALTCTLKGLDGNAPSSTNPVFVWIRDVTVTVGSPTLAKITSATSASFSSGSTAGARNNVPFRIWAVLFNDAGTFRLALMNCVTTVAGSGAGSDVTQYYPLGRWAIDTSTAEGGAGAADSAQTFYSTVAVTSKPYTPIGYATWESGLAAVGTWGTAPTRQHLYMPGTPLPGERVQLRRNDTGAMTTGATQVPLDDTIPQITEGDQYLTQAITPTSGANLLVIAVEAVTASSSATVNAMIASIHQDATLNALATEYSIFQGASQPVTFVFKKAILAAQITSTTLRLRIGASVVGTTTLNGRGGARDFGGAIETFMEVEEIMG